MYWTVSLVVKKRLHRKCWVYSSYYHGTLTIISHQIYLGRLTSLLVFNSKHMLDLRHFCQSRTMLFPLYILYNSFLVEFAFMCDYHMILHWLRKCTADTVVHWEQKNSDCGFPSYIIYLADAHMLSTGDIILSKLDAVPDLIKLSLYERRQSLMISLHTCRYIIANFWRILAFRGNIARAWGIIIWALIWRIKRNTILEQREECLSRGSSLEHVLRLNVCVCWEKRAQKGGSAMRLRAAQSPRHAGRAAL